MINEDFSFSVTKYWELTPSLLNPRKTRARSGFGFVPNVIHQEKLFL